MEIDRLKIACILFAGPTLTICAGGRDWPFEEPHYGGPFVLGKRGDPLANQPGARSPFWRAFGLWNEQGRRVVDGRCVWDEPPPETFLHLGGRNYVRDTPENRAQFPRAPAVQLRHAPALAGGKDGDDGR